MNLKFTMITAASAVCVLAAPASSAENVLGVSVAATDSVDLAASPDAIQIVPTRYRPIWRWWWPAGRLDHIEIENELKAIKAAGFGGVEQSLLRDPNYWWSTDFHTDTKFAVQKSTELGLRFDATLGPEWPVSSQAVTETTGMQEAVWSSVNVAGGHSYAGPVPWLNDGIFKTHTLVGVTAARVIKNGFGSSVAGGNFVPTLLDSSSAVDLTNQVRHGLLNWQAPAGGIWKIIAVWMRATGQRPHGDLKTLIASIPNANLPFNLPFMPQIAGPLVPDHFSAEVTKAMLADFDRTLFGGDMDAIFRLNGSRVFEDSLELNHDTLSTPLGGGLQVGVDGCIGCNGVFWTPTFLDEFKQRRGYELRPFLPAALGAFDFPNHEGERIKHDYDKTISELLEDYHYKLIRTWANAHGIKSRAQGYDFFSSDKTHVSKKLELPDAESLAFGDSGSKITPGSAQVIKIINDYRTISSAAHLSGAKEITLEAGATPLGEYNNSFSDYKILADRAFAGGVTTIALHGFAYRTFRDSYQAWEWPGWSAFNVLFAESWNQRHPAFALWNGLAGYCGRIGAALQNGKPRVDLLVLSVKDAAHEYGTTDVSNTLFGSDYTWDRIDDASMAELDAPPTGSSLLPDGPAYKALVLDNLPIISQSAAQRILEIAQSGVPVILVGSRPARGVSYLDVRGEDLAISRIFDSLLSLGNVRQVADGQAIISSLSSMSVDADLRKGNFPIISQHRRTSGGDVWFLYNNSTSKSEGLLNFKATGAPSQIDPWTGISTQLGSWHQSNDGVSLPVSLAPGQTALISFSKSTASLHAEPNGIPTRWRGNTLVALISESLKTSISLSNGESIAIDEKNLPNPINIVGPWQLNVHTARPDGDGSVYMILDSLRDWKDIPQLGMISGAATYTALVTIPSDWSASGYHVILDPGDFGGFADFIVNGSPASLPSLPDGGRDITKLIRAGLNTIQCRLATTVTNSIVGAARKGDLRYAGFIKNALQPAGLLGPVRLIPVAELPIGFK